MRHLRSQEYDDRLKSAAASCRSAHFANRSDLCQDYNQIVQSSDYSSESTVSPERQQVQRDAMRL